ncbi:MAG: hypothetical protein MR006_02650, partial [Arcanobacterium sp.]|nr:hypothetical protein [Arcanobacterium sp.]
SVEIFGDGMDSPDLEGFEGLGLFHTWAHLDLWHRHNSFYLGEWKDLSKDLSNKGNTTSDTAARTSAPETTAENSTADTALAKTPTADTATVEIVGFKTQFGHSRTRDGNAPHAAAGLSLTPLFRTKRGVDFDGTEIELNSAASQPTSSEGGAYSSSWGEGVRMNNFMGTYLTGPLLILNPPFTKWLLAQLGVNNPRLPFEEAAMDSYRTRVADFHEPSRHAVLRS